MYSSSHIPEENQTIHSLVSTILPLAIDCTISIGSPPRRAIDLLGTLAHPIHSLSHSLLKTLIVFLSLLTYEHSSVLKGFYSFTLCHLPFPVRIGHGFHLFCRNLGKKEVLCLLLLLFLFCSSFLFHLNLLEASICLSLIMLVAPVHHHYLFFP